MKRIVFALTLCCMILAGATKSLAETRWGVVAVGNYSKLNFNQDLAGWVGENRQTPLHGDNGFGGGAGLIGEIIIPGIGFSVDGSLIYSLYTTTVNFGDRAVWGNDGYGNERLSNHTLEIPLNLKFKYTNLNGIENIIAPLAYVGPTFTIHLADNSNGANAVNYKSMAVGIHVGAGCELFRKIQVSASYTWGINKTLTTIKLDDLEAKNKYWRVQVAYFF